MFFFASPSLFRGGFVFFHIFFSMFLRVLASFKKIIHIYCLLYRNLIYICKVNKAQNKNINDMTTEFNTIEDILNSKEFNEMFDIEAEKKEIEAKGWNYAALISFGEQLAKQL